MVKLSFCLPVYNQLDLVEKCISSIIEYKGEDIEIIVSDDKSTEDIQALINRINDPRIKYVRNETNLGHDLNIINAMMKANSSYVYLLRSRDKVISKSIKKMIDAIYSCQLFYHTNAAVDENGKIKICYNKTKIYKNKLIRILKDAALYTHPSGSVYLVDKVLLGKIKEHIEQTVDPKYSFVAHIMLRSILCVNGRIGVSKEIGWVYTNTEGSKDVATNSLSNKKSVYSYDMQLERLYCILLWYDKQLSGMSRKLLISLQIRNFIKQVTWVSKLRYENKSMRQHYNFEYININASQERKKALNDIHRFFSQFALKKGLFINTCIKMFVLENVIIDSFKYKFLWK